MIHLGNNLISQTKDLKSIVLASDYLVSYAGSNNEFYVCSYANGQITTERFDGSGNKINQLATALSFHKKYDYNFVAQYDSLRENSFDLALAYLDDKKDPLIRLYRFDFNNKTTIVTEPIPNDRDYLKSLKAANPDSKLDHFADIKYLVPLQIINTPEKTFLIKEIQTSRTDEKGNTSAHFRMGSIISVYSKDLKLIKDIPINKWSSNRLWSMNQIHGHAKGNKLYVVTNENDGLLGYQSLLYTISMNDFSMTSKNIPDPESGINWITTPDNILWYNTNFIIPFLNAKASFKLKLNTAWVAENY
ncbi:MAG: hypothetical protein ABI185_06215 [Ginsengibacter sp.]